jgi:YfiR/HmsC-like
LRIRSLAFICALVCLVTSVTAEEREYQIKAEFLERFTRFIEWPDDSTVSNPSSPFSICIIGRDRYGSYLKDLAATTKIHKKKIDVKYISSLQEVDQCNLLFISDSEKAALASILAYTAEKPILTVSDAPGFAEQGVLINFYQEAEFVRFEINPLAVQKSRLRFSSRLLKLGRLVSQQGRNPGIKDATP